LSPYKGGNLYQLHCNSSSVLIIGHLVQGLFRAFFPLSVVVQICAKCRSRAIMKHAIQVDC